MIQLSRSKEETIEVGEKFAQSLKGGEVVCLYGDLGSGKTTFTQGLAKGLGIKNRILSPTFIIVRHYPLNIKDLNIFYHIDLYRIESPNQAQELGLKDMIANPKNIISIEWPERLGIHIPDKRIDIHFTYIDENKRKIQISG